ncbi:MAG: cation-translocating P-type ATPase [Alphaproteobacteria bacterium]|nr:cation-translocating P-type ATPase [Alphaproteobacteria bacterium]MDP6255976.1 cation-translocating P-type ATPase [Alphaproteobacteria bacterium]MDP7054272.1 cation-translocating P-type ATPase [Alphaproteobacteria bacterium]MDP7229934.1 cation-translocating P-type ATPase [Alphaproteobacteria bacterium]MDP7460049.1 cation-translocating P-type ATPase [Alphaproteobacteria bacterium]
MTGKPADQKPEYGADPQGAEAFLRIDGMHCASCELLIERTASRIEGIYSATANYATSTARIVFNASIIGEDDLPAALSGSGYRARLCSDGAAFYDDRKTLLRLLIGTCFAAVVMMLYLAFYYPIHLGLISARDLEAVGWLAFDVVPYVMLILTTGLIFYVGAPILRGAWIGLRARALNMDNLLAIAILAAYGYSIGQFFSESLDLYFDVASVIVAVVTIGRYNEHQAKAHATGELTNIMTAWTPRARVQRKGRYRSVSTDELQPDDRIAVGQWETIPVDGTIVAGIGGIDESFLTGEPFPITRGAGETVLGGSIVKEGELEIMVGPKVQSQMDVLARILWSVQSSATGVQGLADRAARLFVPLVLGLAAGVTFWFILDGAPPGAALLAGLATLIVSCPCTFGLAIPLTTAVGVGTALRQGIIITSAAAFEKIPRPDIIAIDKTGILSTGDMAVTELEGPPEMAGYAAAVERLSPHPIAEAIARLDSRQNAIDLKFYPGWGAVARVDGRRVAVGGKALFAFLGWEIPGHLTAFAVRVAPGDGVVSYVGWEGRLRGAIVTRDQSRPQWERVVDALRQNSRVVLLTGAAHSSGYEERVDQVFAGVPPEAKAAVIRGLKSEGTVAMIGDGSNDAPALAAADLGIAFGAPTSLAAEAADVVIPGERLERIFSAFELIDIIRRRVRQNLGWALLYNAVAIPLAVSGYLNPLFAAVAMSASSLLVVWNSARSMASTGSLSLSASLDQANPKVLRRLGTPK